MTSRWLPFVRSYVHEAVSIPLPARTADSRNHRETLSPPVYQGVLKLVHSCLVGLVCISTTTGGDSPSRPHTCDEQQTAEGSRSIPAFSLQSADRPFVVWKQRIGHSGAQLATDGRVIVVGTNELSASLAVIPYRMGPGGSVLCLKADDGTPAWLASHEYRSDGGFIQSVYGVASTPTIAGERVYYVSNRGELVCADLLGHSDGEDDGMEEESVEGLAPDFVWTLDMPSELSVYRVDCMSGNPTCGPCVWEDMVFAVTGNGCAYESGHSELGDFVPASNAPSFIAVNRETGHVEWASNAPGKNIVYSWSSPVVWNHDGDSTVVFPGGDGSLYAFEARTGLRRGRIDLNPPVATFWTLRERGTRCFFVGAPTIVDGMLYSGLAQDHHGWALDAPLFAIDLDAKDGLYDDSVLWRFRDADYSCTYSRALVHESLVFVMSEDTGSVFAISRTTGRVQRALLDFAEGRTTGFPGMQMVDGLLLVPVSYGLALVTADSTMAHVATIEYGEKLIGTPVHANGTLYLPLREWLYALDYQTLLAELAR